MKNQPIQQQFEDYWLMKGQFQAQKRTETAIEFEKRVAQDAWNEGVDQMQEKFEVAAVDAMPDLVVI